jgi:ATP-dependent RNA helicase RhlB
MLFSATFSQDILNLVKSWICEPTMIEIESENVVATLIDQQFFAVSQQDKLALLLWILKHEKYSRMLIFGNRKDHNISLARKLNSHGIKVVVLSGDVPQKKRMSILESFRTGETKLIVSTDVAARGIHVDDISHVINYDLPERADDYVHRIGRTGRAGESGKSISFVCEYGAYVLEELEKTIGNKIETIQPEENMLHLEPVKYRRQRERRR